MNHGHNISNATPNASARDGEARPFIDNFRLINNETSGILAELESQVGILESRLLGKLPSTPKNQTPNSGTPVEAIGVFDEIIMAQQLNRGQLYALVERLAQINNRIG